MSAKHTPGPWRLIDETGDELAITTDDRMDCNCVEIVAVAIGWDEPLESEQQANARLIAAAPELLEALLATYEALGISYPLHSSDMDKRGAVLAKACAAIAKATGEAA